MSHAILTTINSLDGASYQMTSRDLSMLMSCAPQARKLVEKLSSVTSKALDNLRKVDLVSGSCRPFVEFSNLLHLVSKSTAQLGHSDTNEKIYEFQKQWLRQGIFCDQYVHKTNSRCSVIPSFMYANLRYFQNYQEMKTKGMITPFEGKMSTMKDPKVVKYLDRLEKSLISYDLNKLLTGFSNF